MFRTADKTSSHSMRTNYVNNDDATVDEDDFLKRHNSNTEKG